MQTEDSVLYQLVNVPSATSLNVQTHVLYEYLNESNELPHTHTYIYYPDPDTEEQSRDTANMCAQCSTNANVVELQYQE